MLTFQTDFISGISINIDINQKHDFIPKNQSIKKYIDSEIRKVLAESLAEDRDAEHVSFIPKNDFILTPFFRGANNYNVIGFKNDTLARIYNEEGYYIFDLYNSFSESNQKLLSRNFIKLARIYKDINTTDITFESKKIAKEYRNIYIPSYFIDTTTADTFYLKVSFFNPVNGYLRFFQCNNNNDSSKNYLQLKIDREKRTYQVIGGIRINIINQTDKFKLVEVIDSLSEANNINGNRINNIGPPEISSNRIITTRGTFIR
jgi:hypothetical protein